MSIDDKIFKPRRGTKTTFSSTKANTILAEGEIFFEVPDNGQGTGRVRVKMGDGSTTYSSLPYAIPFTEDEIIIHDGNTNVTITASSSIQSTGVATNLNNAKSGNTLKTIIHNLREAIYKCACDISYLDNKAGGSYIGMIIYSTILSTESDVIAKYGGTTWISLSGYMLRGATSGVTANSNNKDGGSDDAIVVSHSHTTPNHNHTFTGTAKNYTSGNQSANHTHSGTTGIESNDHAHLGEKPYDAGTYAYGYSGGQTYKTIGTNAYTGGVSANHTHSFTTGNNSANHTHTTSITPEGTIGNASPTTNSTGSNGTNANLPNYKNVYIWERTA